MIRSLNKAMVDPMGKNREILQFGGSEKIEHALKEIFSAPGYRLMCCQSVAELEVLLPNADDGLVLLCCESQDLTCDLLIRKIHSLRPGLAVVVIASTACIDHAVSAISSGAADYLVYPFDQKIMLGKIDQLLIPDSKEGLVAKSPSTRHCAQLARRVAGTNASILISGESGTGKEVFAQYIHNHSVRSSQPFVAVNCAAIPENMLESILFGYEKGAFTGAVQRSRGKFEQADGGTLFLDELAEMPLEQQAKLLRVLQEKEVDRLGGAAPVPVDVRVISATNCDLAERVKDGLFREDLFYRLNVFPLYLQPLRERKEDILPIARKMLGKLSCQSGQPVLELSDHAVSVLLEHKWPGNIRELENVLHRASILKKGWVIMPADLMLPTVSSVQDSRAEDLLSESINLSSLNSSQNSSLKEYQVKTKVSDEIATLPGSALKQREWRHVLEVLQRNSGARNKTAEQLGMTTRMLRYKLAQLREYGVDVDSFIARGAIAS